MYQKENLSSWNTIVFIAPCPSHRICLNHIQQWRWADVRHLICTPPVYFPCIKLFIRLRNIMVVRLSTTPRAPLWLFWPLVWLELFLARCRPAKQRSDARFRTRATATAFSIRTAPVLYLKSVCVQHASSAVDNLQRPGPMHL